ncbi:MAG: hypothetical protein OEQ53_02610 [Saprospiraceae bacterium]|nr:hypothetical protein [Saprospiraceae bacterium]
MEELGIIVLLVSSILSFNTQEIGTHKNVFNDELAINKSIENWDKAWETKNLELAVKNYADVTDWTNAFGDRVQSKVQLRKLLAIIFSMNFVMIGENNYEKNEIIFLNDSIATVRSKNIRKNQEWADGSKMADRHINHLRVYHKFDGEWLIVNHMISQAWPKDAK